MMSGNKQGSCLEVADMQYKDRVNDYGSGSKTAMYNSKSSRISRTEDRLNTKQVSRTNGYASSSRSKSTSSKSIQPTTKAKLSNRSDFSNNEKSFAVSILPGCKNGVNCLSGSSDNSGSDVDIEIDLDVNTRGHAFSVATNIAARSHRMTTYHQDMSMSMPSESSLLLIDTDTRKRSARFVRGRLGNQVGEVNWDNQHQIFTSDVEMTEGAGTSTLSYMPSRLEETELPSYNIETPEVSLMVRHLDGCQCGNVEPISMDNLSKEILDAEAICDCKVGHSGYGDLNASHGKCFTDKTSNHFKGVNVGHRDSVCKRRNCDRNCLHHKPVVSTPNGLGFRGNSVVGRATNSSKHNISNLSCSSSADVLPSVPSFCFNGNSDRSCCIKAVGPNMNANKIETIRGLKSGKRPVSAVAVGCLAYKNSRDDGSFTERTSSKVSGQPSRRWNTTFQSEMWCPRSLPSVEPSITISNSSSASMDHQSTSCSRGCRGGSPSVSRGRIVSRPSTRFNEHDFVTTVTHGQKPSQRCAASSSRGASPGKSYGNHFGPMGVEVRDSRRSRTYSRNSSSSTAIFTLDDQEMPNLSSFSGPPPSRPPPPLPGLVSNQQAASYYPLSSISSYLSNSHVPQAYATTSDRNNLSNMSLGPRFTRPFPPMDDQYKRQPIRVMESLLCRPSHGTQVQSVGESQSRLMMEGLSEILTALENVERDEELSYEQILMLEATILLGGMGLHDQYRDMRLDVDNMSYEELLALEERIGSVSTGLSEDVISKCVKRSRYSSLNASINYVPQEIEVKCSICQEEFVENADLGILECSHSYHVTCINQWLLQKNQCPICKASAILQL